MKEWRKVTKPDLRKKKIWGPKFGRKGPKCAKNEVYCHFLNQKPYDCAEIEHDNKEQQYLADGSGPAVGLVDL